MVVAEATVTAFVSLFPSTGGRYHVGGGNKTRDKESCGLLMLNYEGVLMSLLKENSKWRTTPHLKHVWCDVLKIVAKLFYGECGPEKDGTWVLSFGATQTVSMHVVGVSISEDVVVSPSALPPFPLSRIVWDMSAIPTKKVSREVFSTNRWRVACSWGSTKTRHRLKSACSGKFFRSCRCSP